MKKLLGTLLISSSILSAGDVTLYFPAQLIELRPLTLLDVTKQSTPVTLSIGAPPLTDHREHSQPSSKLGLVSGMPIIVPKDDINLRILKAPDPAIDFKLIIKSPNVDPAGQMMNQPNKQE